MVLLSSLPFRGASAAGVVAALLLTAAAFHGQTPAPAKQEPPAPAKEAAAPAKETEEAKPPSGPAEYVGSVVCQGCHEEIFKGFQKNAHVILETHKGRGWEEKACESCHGPGSKHAESVSPEDIINPAKQKASSADRNCLKCHINQPSNAGRIHGGHARSQVACVTCHSMHKPQPKVAQMRTAQCVTCHTSTWAEFQKPYRHNLPEGSMTCVDCHNPHGSMPHKVSAMLNTSLREPGCFKCHGDKRGPFTFEHAPVKMEGCTTCHQPHGSNNPRQLTRQEVRFQCLECHTNLPAQTVNTRSSDLGVIPPAFHDLRNPRFRNCTVCHIKIHGSHVNRSFTR